MCKVYVCEVECFSLAEATPPPSNPEPFPPLFMSDTTALGMDQMSYFFKNACFQFDKENFSCVREMCKAKRDLQDLIEKI